MDFSAANWHLPRAPRREGATSTILTGLAAGLLFVMGGAASTFGLLYWLATRRARPVLWARLRVPRERPLDRPLFVGTTTFGIGWGLVGLCPGPAVTSLASGGLSIVAFVVAMVCGIGAADWLRARA